MMVQRAGFAVVGVLLLAGLWLMFRPQTPPPQAAPRVLDLQSAAALSAPAAKSFELILRDGKLVSGAPLLQVRQGEQVTLRIESNASDELHMHGYDLRLPIKAGEPATLQFTASRSGRFELELHKRHAGLGALEVYPQ